MNDCIFCKIIKGEIPSTKIYENEDVYAFLDIAPINIGHTLVIPKKHFVNIYETPEDIMLSMMKATKTISKAIKSELNADGINITMNNDLAAGQIIFHSHIHIIPRTTDDGFSLWHGKRPYHEGESKEVASKIIQAL